MSDRPQILLRLHHEYDLPKRGQVETEDRGWIDWRKAKRLRRRGEFHAAPPLKERMQRAALAAKAWLERTRADG